MSQKFKGRKKVGKEQTFWPTVDCSKVPSKTKQAFKKECDINVIMKRYVNTKDPRFLQGAKGNPIFADVSGIGDFFNVNNRVMAAKDAFEGLPKELRARFDNDHVKLVQFLEKPENAEEAMELGILPKQDKTVQDAEPPVKPAAKAPEAEQGGDKPTCHTPNT